eukprot:1146512-Pelagomonas_calceolata.AAC.5
MLSSVVAVASQRVGMAKAATRFRTNKRGMGGLVFRRVGWQRLNHVLQNKTPCGMRNSNLGGDKDPKRNRGSIEGRGIANQVHGERHIQTGSMEGRGIANRVLKKSAAKAGMQQKKVMLKP